MMTLSVDSNKSNNMTTSGYNLKHRMHDPKTYTNAYGGQVDAFWYISLRKMNQSCFYRYFKGYGLI